MLTQRASGILLHPSSLPGPFGSGDFGAGAFQFIDWLHQAGQRYWQVLPLGEVGPGNSPYMSRSAFAGNILLIDLVDLANKGWLNQEELQCNTSFFNEERVEFGKVGEFRLSKLRCAFDAFSAAGGGLLSSLIPCKNNKLKDEFKVFSIQESAWLDDYALFMALANEYRTCNWNQWPSKLASRNKKELDKTSSKLSNELDFWRFCQWQFDSQWRKIKEYAHQKGVAIIGDVPIFVAYESADVWAHQELFDLDENGKANTVAGVPPDYFSETGQLWGNPHYRWDRHAEQKYAWWLARLRQTLRHTDLLRIDHFRGFSEYWEIPAGAENAISGQWQTGPREHFFEAVKAAFPSMPILAEDLGIITDEVIALRDKFSLPGMRILQFAFGGGDDNPHLPMNYVENSVAYTGTHDNDTTVGWWGKLSSEEQSRVETFIGNQSQDIHIRIMSYLMQSIANTVIIPMQDVLGLPTESRMNTPGTAEGNWEWRCSTAAFNPDTAELLSFLTKNSGRG